MSAREKERLLRIARKDRRGPLNSIVDPSQPGAGSALLEVSEAVKKSGQYDVWSAEDIGIKVKVCPAPTEGCSSRVDTRMQAPDVPHPRTAITLPAVPAPHAGTSYNPPEVAHTALLLSAYGVELRSVQEAEVLEATKSRMLSARNADGEGNVQGMLVDKPGDDVGSPDGSEQETESVHTAKNDKAVPQRKTKQQRRKSQMLRAEVSRQLPHPCARCTNLRSPLILLETCPCGAHPA